MKKIMIVFIFLGFILASHMVYNANSDYRSYENIEMAKGKMIYDWSDDEHSDYIKKVSGRQFFGWKTHTVNKEVKVTYDTETLFSYYNDGYTAIDYEYEHIIKETHKVSLSASGSIGVTETETKKEFKNGLNASLKLDASYSYVREENEKYQIKLKVDPGTQVDLYIHGEGKITNGVAANYFFFFRTHEGAFEIFKITTQYYRLEKKKI